MNGAVEGDAGITHGALLARICDAVTYKDRQAMKDVRAEATAAMGVDSFIDAVAVSALFQMMNRVANGTGTPLDAFMVEPTKAITAQIGANEFLSSDDTLSVYS